MRASTAALIVEITTAFSAAFITVQRPVPFCPALSVIISTNGWPLSSSVMVKILLVIWIRYDSSSPWFHWSKDVGHLLRRNARRS